MSVLCVCPVSTFNFVTYCQLPCPPLTNGSVRRKSRNVASDANDTHLLIALLPVLAQFHSVCWLSNYVHVWWLLTYQMLHDHSAHLHPIVHHSRVMVKKEKERKSIYIVSFIYCVYLKALRHGSHSFTCKLTMPAFPSYAFTRWRHF